MVQGPLRNLIQGPLTREAIHLRVRDVLTDAGWQWGLIPFELPYFLKSLVQAVPFATMSRGSDKLAWAGNPRGSFDLKSAYSMSLGDENNPRLKLGWVWKLETLPRIKSFIWRCAHNSVGVKGCLLRRGIGDDDRCPICRVESESILHALRDCARVKDVWIQLGVGWQNREFWNDDLQDWLRSNGKDNSSHGGFNWRILFPIAVWSIWKCRNQCVFNGKSYNPRLAACIRDQAVEFLCYVAPPRQAVCNVIKRIRWERPPIGWKKLNTDGSSLGSNGQAGCGGTVRDEHGRWLAGFSKSIGSANAFVAELWGLRDGLALCSNLNIQCLLVEVDSSALVLALLNPKYVNLIVSPLLDDCRHLLSCFPQVQINHCFRQANRCADVMARMGSAHCVDASVFHSPPVDVLEAFEADLNGLFFDRSCPVLAVAP